MYYKSLDHVLAALVHAKTNPKKALAHFKAASRCADLSKAVASLEKHQRAAFASLTSVSSSKVEAAKKAAKKDAKKDAKNGKKKVKAQTGDFDALIDDLTQVEESDLGLDPGDDLTLDDISNDLTSIDDEDSLDADLGLDDLDLDDVEMDEGLSDGLDDLDLDGDLDGGLDDDLDGEFASDDEEEDEEFDLEDEEDEEIEDEVVESSAKRGRGSVTAHASAVNRMARANSNLRALSRLSTTASAGKSAKKPVSRRTPGV